MSSWTLLIILIADLNPRARAHKIFSGLAFLVPYAVRENSRMIGFYIFTFSCITDCAEMWVYWLFDLSRLCISQSSYLTCFLLTSTLIKLSRRWKVWMLVNEQLYSRVYRFYSGIIILSCSHWYLSFVIDRHRLGRFSIVSFVQIWGRKRSRAEETSRHSLWGYSHKTATSHQHISTL